ncbi:MAG: class I SAM-dependent methyltransferase [Nanoarchaeota archaeon]|nr:class I SAM-dependent methyltransferase [Nanoarchaeota archaeon]MBU1320996.1 class I SAM-dependent methyltransferase [Nanoarchaeota archaeon]MBU1596867.1 class I SAM-dependent methyltransferase [Nanoarchaeota archaeon]MBU2440794.1 class I SAM-dependent methyltransferase [Nanoarchaeota archaeon]
MKLYKEKAYLYDLFIAKTKRDYATEARLIAKQLSGLKTVLELGCGTGKASLELSRLGFDVTCSDINKEILRLAKQKTTLKSQILDMRKFKLKKKVDAILSLFNTLSYNKNESELRQNLRSCYNSLNKKGMIVLGVTKPEVLLKKGRDFARLWRLNEKDLLIQIDEFKGNKLQHTFILFNLDSEKVMIDKHKTVIFQTKTIERVLKENKFKKIKIIDCGYERYFFAEK